MQEETLYDLVVQAQFGQKESILVLCECFKATLEKYSRKLRSEDGKQDLMVAFLELLPHIPLGETCHSDEQIIAYTKASIYHEFIKLSKRSAKKKACEYVVDFNEEASIGNSAVVAVFDDTIMEQLFWLDDLTYKQKSIIFLHYFCGYPIKEIADILGTSRQAVNKIKNAALKKLRNYYEK